MSFSVCYGSSSGRNANLISGAVGWHRPPRALSSALGKRSPRFRSTLMLRLISRTFPLPSRPSRCVKGADIPFKDRHSLWLFRKTCLSQTPLIALTGQLAKEVATTLQVLSAARQQTAIHKWTRSGHEDPQTVPFKQSSINFSIFLKPSTMRMSGSAQK